jgi:hypothetical protein
MKLTDNQLAAIKSIAIADVMEWLGYSVRSSGNWLSVKGDNSLKGNVKKNTYIDFSGRLGSGSVIDLVMQSQGCDFKTACQMLQSRFLGGEFVTVSPQNTFKQVNITAMKKYLANDFVEKFLHPYFHKNNGLAKFLQGRFASVSDVLQRMNVGTSREGAAVFFYRNAKLQYEALKVVPYDSQTGKRSSGINIPKGYQAQDGYVQNCFFNECAISGVHTVFVVESEKTAVVATLYFNEADFAFVATGGAQKLQSLLSAKLPILENKRVVLLPDNDAAGSGWMDVKKQFAEDDYQNIELWWLDRESPEGSDLADFILGTDDTWKRTFDKLLNKNKEQVNVQPSAALPAIEIPELDILELDIPIQPVQEVSLQTTEQAKQALPMVGESHCEVSTTDKQGVHVSDVEDLIAFFDGQILPEKVQFFNSDGYCYEVLTNPTHYVLDRIANLKDAIAAGYSETATLDAYHLRRLKKVIETGAYMPRKLDDVPF